MQILGGAVGGIYVVLVFVDLFTLGRDVQCSFEPVRNGLYICVLVGIFNTVPIDDMEVKKYKERTEVNSVCGYI